LILTGSGEVCKRIGYLLGGGLVASNVVLLVGSGYQQYQQ
jgi:hypothetical protein